MVNTEVYFVFKMCVVFVFVRIIRIKIEHIFIKNVKNVIQDKEEIEEKVIN